MEKKQFGRTADGKEATLYTISNQKGMRVQVTDYGATLVSIFVKDRDGKDTDVILGYDEVADYQKRTCYLGATIGRNCNRISGAEIEIDGETYALEANDRGNNLHSGSECTSCRFWDVKDYSDSRIVLEIQDAHLQQGFPGNATMEVTFEVTEDNGLSISYYAVSDQKTVFNMTSHGYFNLNGAKSGTAKDHTLQIKASHYTPVRDSKAIPTGEIAAVEGTPFDFRTPKTIGRDIRVQNEQLSYGNGYDHNFALDKEKEGLETVAAAYGPKTGIRMEVITDAPGLQLYTANFIGGQNGKGGIAYADRDAFCLEAQYFPNAVNEPNFVSPLTEAGEAYRSQTIYKFSIA